MRISLGLKPLVIGDGGAAKAEAEKRAAERAEEARRVQAEELAERVKACVPCYMCLAANWALPALPVPCLALPVCSAWPFSAQQAGSLLYSWLVTRKACT